MGSILQTTLNTRALPTGNLRYVRSDYPGKLTDEEVHWLLQNDITTIVDLREAKEYETRPCRLEKEEEFDYYHLPVTGGGDVPESLEVVAQSYLKMLDGRMDQIIDIIMNAKSNVMYFCSAGKDRTGVVSAIILRKLGFSVQAPCLRFYELSQVLNSYKFFINLILKKLVYSSRKHKQSLKSHL